jgi:hypothetical protein
MQKVLESSSRIGLVPSANAGDPAIGVCHQISFGLIQYRQFVPERVANARTPAYRQVERRLDSLAARPQECRKRFVDVGDDNVRLGPNAEVDNQFRIRLWSSKPTASSVRHNRR